MARLGEGKAMYESQPIRKVTLEYDFGPSRNSPSTDTHVDHSSGSHGSSDDEKRCPRGCIFGVMTYFVFFPSTLVKG